MISEETPATKYIKGQVARAMRDARHVLLLREILVVEKGMYLEQIVRPQMRALDQIHGAIVGAYVCRGDPGSQDLALLAALLGDGEGGVPLVLIPVVADRGAVACRGGALAAGLAVHLNPLAL